MSAYNVNSMLYFSSEGDAMRLLTIFFVCASLSACGLFGVNRKPHSWAQAGTRFIYDFQPVNGSTSSKGALAASRVDSAVIIDIVEADVSGLMFKISFPEGTGLGSNVPFSTGFRTFYRRYDGLYASVYAACEGMGFIPFFFMRLPADPHEGQEIPIYVCADEVIGAFSVSTVGKVLETPVGSIETFVVVGSRRFRRYWSKKHGLVRVDVLSDDGELLGYYELSAQ